MYKIGVVAMARMYPTQVSSSTTSSAERLLFTQLQAQLPGDWIVMHSVGWLTRTRRTDVYGEADFVIVHPDRGVLVLEVKGGRIVGKWADDDWFSVDRIGRKHPIKNPVKQANRAMWTLKARLEDTPATARFQYPRFHGVAFPDMLVGDAGFGIDFDRSLVIDSSNMPDLLESVSRMMPVRPDGPRLSKAAVDALVELIQPVIEINRPGLAAQVMAGEAEIIRLTDEQAAILGFLQNQRRAVINGCAGSGKTMLAMEKAIRLATDGLEVLLTCYNKNLAAWMGSVIAAQAPEVASLIKVSHYHDLAFRLCAEAGMPSTVEPGDSDYWNQTLPNQLLEAIPHVSTRFDAIVADEGQDFEDGWWLTLLELLRDPDDGVFYIFQDERQDIYRRRANLPFEAAPYPLQGNLRNTAAIHQQVAAYYDGEPKPRARGPAGREIEVIGVDAVTMPKALRSVLHRLVAEENVRPSQIVILTPHGRERSALAEGARLASLGLTWATVPGEREIRISSIHSFKGLESDIVILAETDRLTERDDGQRLCYVALSRAKHHLIVLGALPPAT